MSTVTLVFPTIRALWSFVDLNDVNYTEVNNRTSTLICECMEADLVLAVRDFGAFIINEGTISS